MKWLALVLVLVPACIAQVQSALAPAPTTTGTSTCREIVETCDRTCSDPLCVRNCTTQGTAEAQTQHTAVVDCAQQHGCMDEACIHDSCAAEAATCEGPPPQPS